MATKKVAKKVVAPKPAKVAKPANKNNLVKLPESGTASWTAPVTLVSFSVSAVIPTQQYGNIQPKIEVTASSIEAARASVMPVIEDLYRTYAELPLNGKEPKFLGKVTEEVKQVVAGGVLNNPNVAQTAPVAPTAQDVPAQVTTASSAPETPQKPKSDAVLKAEKAISLAMSEDAAKAIQDQIEKSVKIAPEDKPDLITLVLNKRNEFKGK